MSANSEHIIHNLFLCNQKMVPHTQISSDAFESSLHDRTRTGDGASRRGWLWVILRPEAEEAKISSPIGTGAHGRLKGGMSSRADRLVASPYPPVRMQHMTKVTHYCIALPCGCNVAVISRNNRYS